LVEKWENACDLPENITKTVVRLGVVLDYNSGALPKMLMTLPFRFATLFGNGNNYIGAIWLQDIPKKIDLILKNKMEGMLNLVGAENYTQKSLIEYCAKKQHRSCFFIPIPAFLLKILLGDFSEVMLNSQRVVSNRM
jgi:NAD dependent epimerase/dehydratase family enzyme